MAKLNSDISFLGSIGDITAYKRRGTKGVVVKKKSHPSKEDIKHAPHFKLVRLNNSEFGGRSTATYWVRRAIWPQKALGGPNFTGELNSLAKHIQELDTMGALGERAVLFTKSNGLLNGFNLNETVVFDSIVRNPVNYTLSKETLSASLHIPALIPGVNFVVPGKPAMYKIVAALGILPDLHYNGHKYAPLPAYIDTKNAVAAYTEWHPVLSGNDAETLDLKLAAAPPDSLFTLVLSIGIAFGGIAAANKINQLKHAGAAKIAVAV